jgi:hypothetical protein
MDKKIAFEELPLKTMEVTIHALRWIFLLVLMFISIGIVVLFITGGQTYVQAILGYSITGFFTFFMGYFGWILAQQILEMVIGKEEHDKPRLSYYLRKSKNYRY